MKLHLESAGTLNAFSAYGEGYVVVGGRRIEKSVVVLPERILEDWPARRFDELAAEHFEMLAGLGLEILVLGTGPRLRFPPPQVLRPLIEAGLGVEVMDLQAACRTYNILMAEDRKVAAALLFE